MAMITQGWRNGSAWYEGLSIVIAFSSSSLLEEYLFINGDILREGRKSEYISTNNNNTVLIQVLDSTIKISQMKSYIVVDSKQIDEALIGVESVTNDGDGNDYRFSRMFRLVKYK